MGGVPRVSLSLLPLYGFYYRPTLSKEEMTSANLATSSSSWKGVGGQQVAVCALIYFYVHEEPLNEAGPLLSRLLSYIARLIFQVDRSSITLLHFLQLLSTALETVNPFEKSEETQREASVWVSKIENIILESSTFPGLHTFFTKVERLLMTEELYDEMRNITIKPAERQIDEQSPLGQYLQRCLESYLSLEDEEFAILVREVQGWVAGHASQKEEREEDASIQALNRGDYSLARAELEGFFDRSPLDSSNQTLQEALFRNAMFHYQTKAYESARASLDESLRLSRGVNDLDCISACDRLLQRIKSEDSNSKGQHLFRLLHEPPSFSIHDLWRVDQELDRGKPLLSILTSLHNLLHKGKTLDYHSSLSSKELAECYLYQARVWNDLGIHRNSFALVQTCTVEGSLTASLAFKELCLPIASLESDDLLHFGKVNEALATLFDDLLLQSLTISSFDIWQAQVWKILYQSALDIGSIEGQQAIRAIRPEVVKETEGNMDAAWEEKDTLEEENEASFGRSDSITLSQQLMGNLREAHTLREDGNEYSLSLILSTKVMRRAEESNLFRLYRMAILESSESLLGLGDITKAKSLLEDVMPQLLTEKRTRLRARVAWLYARILLSLREREGIEVDTILPWLDRARKAFKESGSNAELNDVLYVYIKLLEYLGKNKVAQEARNQYEQAQEEIGHGSQNKFDVLFGTVQSAVMLVGARIVTGG